MKQLNNETLTPLLSIVIPMYNSFNGVKKNIEILKASPLSVFIEIIIIDDCSTDYSYQNLIYYTAAIEVKTIVKKNEKNVGPGKSRNNGIMLATGKFLTFIDSDDYVSTDFLKEIFSIIKKDEFDCIIFDYMMVSENGDCLARCKSIGNKKKIVEGIIDNKMALVYVYGTTFGKIYRKSIIDKYHVEFGPFWRNEDMPFTKYALALSKKIYYLPLELYSYVQRKSSLMHDNNLNNEVNCQNAFRLLKNNIGNLCFHDELDSIELREVLNNSVLIKINRGDSFKEISEYIKNNYKKEYFKNRYFRGYPFYVKTISYLVYHRMLFLLKVIGKYNGWRKRKRIES